MEVTLEELAEEIKKEDPREFVTIQIDDVYTLQLLKGTKAKYGSEGDTWRKINRRALRWYSQPIQFIRKLLL